MQALSFQPVCKKTGSPGCGQREGERGLSEPKLPRPEETR